MEYIHTQKNIQTSPRKLRLVADMIRKMTPEKALEALQFTNKSAAEPLAKAIKTVAANAGGKIEALYFKSIEINEGSKLKRVRMGSRGHVNPYKRRWSHIKIVLSDEVISKREEEKPERDPSLTSSPQDDKKV